MKKRFGFILILLFVLLAACSNGDEATSNIGQDESRTGEAPGNEEVEENDEDQASQQEVLEEQEVTTILTEKITAVMEAVYDLSLEHRWSASNDYAQFDQLEPELKQYATTEFIEDLTEQLKNYDFNNDPDFYPRLVYSTRFEFEQNGDTIAITGLSPANTLDNMGVMWQIELVKHNEDWIFNKWESRSLDGQDLQLTKEEAEKIAIALMRGKPTRFITEYHSDEAGGIAFVFEDLNGAISSKDTKLVFDYDAASINSQDTVKKESEGFTYETYTNTRFGFSVDYPSSFTMGEQPTNNDGRKFSNEEAEILAYGHYINIMEENETIETYYNRDLEYISSEIAYERLADDWFVVSYIEGNNIVYKKAVIGENIISHLVITSPVDKREKYDPMVEHILNSFEGGISA